MRWRIIAAAFLFTVPLVVLAIDVQPRPDEPVTWLVASAAGGAFIAGALAVQSGDKRWIKRSEGTALLRDAVQEHELGDHHESVRRELGQLREQVARLESRIDTQGEKLGAKLDAVLAAVTEK